MKTWKLFKFHSYSVWDSSFNVYWKTSWLCSYYCWLWTDIENPATERSIYIFQTYHYDDDEKTKITLKINNDCSSLSSKNGLAPISKNQQIFKIQMEKRTSDGLKDAALDFPNWLQGHWQFLNIDKSHLIFRDQNSFKSYRMTLVNQLNEDKFIVLSRSQCGEESFKCLWIRKLDANILEFQTSSQSVAKFTSYDLCNDEYFDDIRWLTQARKLISVQSFCNLTLIGFRSRKSRRKDCLSNQREILWTSPRWLGLVLEYESEL